MYGATLITMTTKFRALTNIDFYDRPTLLAGETGIYEQDNDGLALLLERGMIELVETDEIAPVAIAEEAEETPAEVIVAEKPATPAKKVAKKSPAKKSVPKS